MAIYDWKIAAIIPYFGSTLGNAYSKYFIVDIICIRYMLISKNVHGKFVGEFKWRYGLSYTAKSLI